MKSLLVIGDRALSSGVLPAIKSLTYSRTAVTETDFCYGAVCPASIQVTVMGDLDLTPGEAMTYYEDGVKMGVFICSQVSRPTAHTVRFTAYDGVTGLDTDISQWLAGLDGWPYTMDQLLALCAEYCGVSLGDVQLANGGHGVQRFLMQLTGRGLVQYLCQANACYAYMDGDERLCFARLKENGALSAIKSASVCDYVTTPIARVAVRQSEDDVGVIWPEVEGETYEILRNPLLATFSREALLPVVQSIAEAVVGLSYTPAAVTVWDCSARAGDIVTFTHGGKTYRTVVFSEQRSGSLTSLKSTGNPDRAALTARYGQRESDVLQGSMTEIRADLEAVSASLSETVMTLDSVRRENSQLKQTAAGLELRVEATEETASRTDTRLTALETDADSLELSIVSIRSQVDGKADKETVAEISETFRFDENGLTISNSATGMGIGVSEEQVAFTGGKDPTTVITPTEMETTNLRVGRQLDLGNFSLIPRTNGNLSMRWTGG